jgi:formate hydrogenlyase subunit 3/multisubunit Na+/H+ antiporter MnhD subunit
LGTARLTIDGLAAWFLAGIALLSLSVALYAWDYMQADIGREPVHLFGALLCLLVAALMLVVTAADVVLFLVGWEVMTLAAFLMVSFHHRRPDVRYAAWVYLIATHLATGLFVLPLFGILAATAGSLDFSAFRTALKSGDPGSCALLFGLGVLGFGTKAGFMPMHIWLPLAHAAAPTPVSAVLSGIVLKTGIYGLFRLLSWLPNLPVTCAVVMLILGMTSGVLGVLYALAQHDLKRLLAYHSVENIGIIGLGIGMGMLGQTIGQPVLVALGYGGALLHVLNHALFKGLLFLSAGAVIHATGTGEIERLGGLARKTPVNAALFLVAAVSICGLPPLNGFVSEWMLYGSLFGGALNASLASAGAATLGAVSLALMGGLALACFAKVFGGVFLGEPRDAFVRAHSTPAFMIVGMLVPAGLCAGIGLLPGLFVPLTAAGVNRVAGLSATEFAGATRTILAPAQHLSISAAVLLGIAVGLWLLRRLLLRRNIPIPAARVATWGCGYCMPSARMQYTSSSFAWSLIHSFRHLIWPDRRVVVPAGAFAGHSELESDTLDVAENDLFIPLFRCLSRLLRMIRTLSRTGVLVLESTRVETGGRIGPLRVLIGAGVTALRRGSIHAYLAFIVLTLLAVFFIEAIASPGPALFSASPPAEVVDGVSK